MATNLLTNTKTWVDQYDLSTHLNTINFEYGAESLDVTTFGATTRIKKGGLKTLTFGLGGFWDETPDERLFDRVGLGTTVLTCGPETGADGEIAYSGKVLVATYQPVGGAVGEMQAFQCGGELAADSFVRTTVMHNATRTANVNGTARQLGAVSATQKLYAALHVTAVSGGSPSLTVKIQSDNGAGFASPTDQITFTAATAIGAQWAAPVAGAITDDYWRATGTISGTTPSFTFIVTVGIL